MPDLEKTEAGAVDDNAAKRAAAARKKKEAMLKAIFDDNETNRHSGPIDK